MGLMLSLTKADIHLSVICFFFFTTWGYLDLTHSGPLNVLPLTT